MPAIADAVAPPVSRLIFVDSGIPARTGETSFVPPAVVDDLRALAVDGLLPPWTDWFGDEAMRELVPDADLLSSLAREVVGTSIGGRGKRPVSVAFPVCWRSRVLWSFAYLVVRRLFQLIVICCRSSGSKESWRSLCYGTSSRSCAGSCGGRSCERRIECSWRR